MISPSLAYQTIMAEEAKLGGFTDKAGVINFPKALAAAAERLGVSQQEVAEAYSRHMRGVLQG